MSKITVAIPPQNYEIVRNRIAEILTDELDNQAILNYDPELEAYVWCERTKAFSSTEVPAVNVSFAAGNYGNKHQGSRDGTYTFNIDIHTQAADSDLESGDIRSAKRSHRLLGCCEYILEDPIYKTLGFAPGFIRRVFVQNILIGTADPGDEMNGAMGRIIFIVEANEKNTLLNPPLIAGYKTEVRMSETSEGYLYQGGTPDE